MKYFYTYLNFTLLFLFSFSAYSQKNVGIGEALPGTKLEIKGDAGTDLLNVKDQSDVSRLYVKENGNVGIGTPDPTEKLHLRGSSTTTGYPTIRLENTSGHTWHIWPIDGNDLRIRDVTDNEDRLTIKGVTGRVGIGTTNPGSKLEVHDATDIIANFKRTNGPSVGISLEGNNGDLTRIYGADKAFRIFHTPFGGTSTEVFTIERNGNANLTGSLSLQYGTAVNEFSIDGTLGGNSDNALPTEQAVKTYVDALVGDNTHWDKDGNNIYNNNSGNVGIGTPDPEEKLNISGNARISNQLFIGDEFSNKGVGSIQIRKEGASNGLTFWTETTGITTKRIWIDDATETMQLTHGAVAGEGLVIDNQGNVGIGMVSPGYKLDVAAGNGGIRIGPNSSFGEDLILGGWATSFSSARVATSNGNLHLDSKGGSNHIYLNHYHSGNIYLAAGSTQGQVGIGTPSPNYKLDVDGTGRYTGQLTIPLLPSAPAHAASKDYVDNQIAGTGDNLGNHTATTNINASDFEVQNVRAIQGKDWDDNSGGTDNKYRLLFRDGAHMFYNGGVAIGSYGNGTWADLADGNLIVKGNVGIGTTSPSASATANTAGSPVLQIGDNSGTPEIRLAGANSIGTSSKIVFDNSSTGDGMSIIFNSNNSATYGPDGFIFMDESNDNPRMKINRDNGHVGIGTTSPSTQLEVISSTTSTNSVAIRAEKEGNAGLSNYHTGFIGRASGHTDGGWYRGVYGNATRATADTDGRTYGVYGVAGNATSGWNYGIYGHLSGSNNGAAVYGTDSDFSTYPDVNTGGRWAGFFNGDVNLEGGLGIDGNKGSNGQVLSTNGTNISWNDPNNLINEEDPTWNGAADEAGKIGRAGNVGIGNTDPQAKLHVTDGGAGPMAQFHAYGNANPSVTIESENNAPGMGVIKLHQASSNTDRIVFTANSGSYWLPDAGNVGIGTTSPSSTSRLHSKWVTSGTGWQRAGLFTVDWSGSSGAQVFAVQANAHKSSPVTSGRSTGVYARAGNATNRWNTGVTAVLEGTNDGAAILAGTNADYISNGYGGSFQPQYVNPAGQWGIVSYSDVYFHENLTVAGTNSSTASYTSTNNMLEYESFEFDDLGGWVNVGTNGTWQTNSGGTGSGGTGPSGASSGNFYAYVETSSPVSAGDVEELEKTFDLSGNDENLTLTFDYHMYFSGATDGILEVTVNGTSEWSLTGEQQTTNTDPWKSATVDLSAYDGQSSITITFKLTVGSQSYAYQYDAAIDNVKLQSRTSGGNLALQVGSQGDGTYAIANTWATFSDKRWKTNFEKIPDVLEKIETVNGYYYNWKDGNQDKSRQIGVIAQEIQATFPEAVSQNAEGYLSVDYSKLTAPLIEAVKQLNDKVKEQESEINALQSERCAIEQIQSENQQLRKEVEEIKEMLMMSANAK